MRNRWTIATCSFVALFGWSVATAEKPPENFQKAMKDIGGSLQAANKAIQAEDLQAVADNAGKIVEAFTVVEKYWIGKADDAVKASQIASKAASDMRVAATLMSADGVVFSNKELTDTCAPCHTAHREKMPDGTFMIK